MHVKDRSTENSPAEKTPKTSQLSLGHRIIHDFYVLFTFSCVSKFAMVGMFYFHDQNFFLQKDETENSTKARRKSGKH